MMDWIWLIPVLPLLGALVNGVILGGRVSKRTVGWVACGSVGASLLLAVSAVFAFIRSAEYAAGRGFEKVLYLWVPAGPLEIGSHGATTLRDFNVEMGFLLDPLSSVMVVVVTLVGFLIHVYSVGYMGDD
ncbi:MAG: hypothetical protein OEM62_11950, partial [Acidobacteriota bacterium]|nr:hypothetical protein [Acidobacteriota bacterium]